MLYTSYLFSISITVVSSKELPNPPSVIGADDQSLETVDVLTNTRVFPSIIVCLSIPPCVSIKVL